MRISELEAELSKLRMEHGDVFVEYGDTAEPGLTVSDVKSATYTDDNTTVVVLD